MNIAHFRQVLAKHEPRTLQHAAAKHAAVAMILCGDQASPQMLLIERVLHAHDPWSGHIAFPGGHVEVHDKTPRHTAERETREELALDLSAAELLGQLDDQHARVANVIVHGFVYYQRHLTDTRLNDEVHKLYRVPLTRLSDRSLHTRFTPLPQSAREFPGIRLDKANGVNNVTNLKYASDKAPHIIWGLTYRFIVSLFTLTGNRWLDEHAKQ